MPFKRVGFAEARSRHHVERKCAGIVSDSLNGFPRAPIPSHVGSLGDALLPDNLEVLIDEAGAHELAHLLPVRALGLRSKPVSNHTSVLRVAPAGGNLTHGGDVRTENIEHGREFRVVGEVVVPLEHTRDDIRVAEIEPVPGRRAQHKGVAQVLVSLPSKRYLKTKVVVLGDAVITEPKRQSPQHRCNLLADENPQWIDMVNGNDPHWDAELAGGKVVAEQTYR